MKTYKNFKLLKEQNIYRDNPSDNVIALIGSKTIFKHIIKKNKINYCLKQINCTIGKYTNNDEDFILINIEKLKNYTDFSIINDFLVFCNPMLIVVVIDLEHIYENLIQILLIREINNNLILCIKNNEKRFINIDYLSNKLSISIIIIDKIDNIFATKLIREIYKKSTDNNLITNKITYNDNIENSINIIENYIKNIFNDVNNRWLSIQLLTNNNIINSINTYLNYNVLADLELLDLLNNEKKKNLDISNIINKAIIEEATELYTKSLN